METKYLSNYEHVLQSIVPGAHLRSEYARGGVTASWGVQVTLGYDRATSEEHAVAEMTALGERMRVVAIRELGLEPILRAHETEVHAAKRRCSELEGMVRNRDSRIVFLEGELAEERGLIRGDEDDF